MAEQIENPVINSDAAEEAALLVASEEADKHGDIADNASDETTTLDQEPSEPDTAVDRPRDELGRFTKTEAGEDIPEADRATPPADAPVAPEPEQKPDSEYTKAQKEAKRREVTWQQINERKTELDNRERELYQRQQQFQQQPQQPQMARPPYSSQELAKASSDFEQTALKALKEGDYDSHGEHLELAKQAREQAQRVYQLEYQEAEQAQMEGFRNTWMNVMHETIKANPDLADRESRLSKEVQQLLENEPLLGHLPDGFARALNQAHLNIRAARADEAQSAYAKLKAENDRLNGLTSIRGSGPTAPPQGREFDSMSLDEQMKALETASENADLTR